METIFRLSSYLVLPLWVLMITLPHWRWTRRIMASPLVAFAPALLYAVLVLPNIGTVLPAVANPSLDGIATLLGSPAGATIAWAHFLAFGLFTGRWIYLDSRQQQLSGWLMAPVLALTLFLGPCGLLSYLGLRSLGGGSSVSRQTQEPVAA